MESKNLSNSMFNLLPLSGLILQKTNWRYFTYFFPENIYCQKFKMYIKVSSAEVFTQNAKGSFEN